MSPDSQPPPKPGYSALRRHRWSSPGADYFVTINLHRPASGLSSPAVLATLDSERVKLESTGHWRVRTWVVMPDHLHVLFTLGPSSTLAEVLRLFKGRLTPALRSSQLAWQEGYYDHLMRPDEDRLPIFLYIFLNPYRANLLPATERWPGYFCTPEDWEWFGPLTNSDVPFPQWLQ
jgi:REP element-mobilizing transposase RayT